MVPTFLKGFLLNCKVSICSFSAGRAQEAEECYLKALSIKPNSADGNINLAHLLRVTGRLPEADVQYRQALSLRPNHPQLNYFHGVVLEKLGKIKVMNKKDSFFFHTNHIIQLNYSTF